MTDAAARGWGGPPTGRDRIVTVRTSGGALLPVNKRVAVLVKMLVRDLEAARGKPFRAGWCWGYAPRLVRGSSSVWSNHAWGLAIDLDAPQNGMGDPGLGTMPKDAGAIARRYGFRWGGSVAVGGSYITRPDPMHFEFMGTPAQALALTRFHTGRKAAKKKAPAKKQAEHRLGTRTLNKGDKGTDVAFVQRFLGLDDDGVFGANTEAAVKRYQGLRRLNRDGIVGAATWRPMLKAARAR